MISERESGVNRYAAPKSAVADVVRPGAAIASLAVSDSWKATFFAIDKAGGVKLPRFKQLTVSQRLKVQFNLFAFLFGPFWPRACGRRH